MPASDTSLLINPRLGTAGSWLILDLRMTVLPVPGSVVVSDCFLGASLSTVSTRLTKLVPSLKVAESENTNAGPQG